MAEAREIRVKVTADVDEHVDAIERARLATTGLADELRACGITDEDLPGAIRATLKLLRDEDGDADPIAM